MNTQSQFAIDHQRRGWTISIVVHALLFLLGIIPFLVKEDPAEAMQAITIDFQDYASKASGASASGSAGARSPRPRVQVNAVNAPNQVKQMPTPQRTMPIITSPQPDIFMPESREAYFDKDLQPQEFSESYTVSELEVEAPSENTFGQSWDISSESGDPGFEPNPLDGTGDSDMDGDPFADGAWPSNGIGEFDGEGDDEIAGSLFNGKWPGELDGTEGTQLGIGQDGQGNYWGDFAGDGLFNRKVIQRANVAQLAVKEGKVVVNLCVDQRGKVIYAECDMAKSTIKDASIIAKSEICATNYIFDEDPTAPVEQCGRLTFIFKIER